LTLTADQQDHFVGLTLILRSESVLTKSPGQLTSLAAVGNEDLLPETSDGTKTNEAESSLRFPPLIEEIRLRRARIKDVTEPAPGRS
jgi:hypothetical protein